eukprot:scaffold206303_cov36-Cyclotella_meneghiniana.AAC.1
MSDLFKNTNFNEPINGWDVSGVERMTDMFRGATQFNQDLSAWNTERVTYMGGMFFGATVFNSNIGGWNVSRVKDMSWMFYKATNFNGNVGNWNVGSVTSMWSMFEGASKFNNDISSWSATNCNSYFWMFHGAVSFNQDLSQWHTTSTMDFRNMFDGATAFDQNLCAWKDRFNYDSSTYIFDWQDKYNYQSYGIFKGTSCKFKDSPTKMGDYYFQNFCSVDRCPSSTGKYPDFIEIGLWPGKWRIAHICETCDHSHLSISSDKIKTSQIFREDGTAHPGPRSDYNGWDEVESLSGPTFSSQGITFGNKAVQIRDWRIRQIDDRHMSVSHKNGNVARIYRSDGTLHGNNKSFSGWKSDLGALSCAYLTENYLQIGDWRFGKIDLDYLSVTHKEGKTAAIYRRDGTIHHGPRTDYNAWDLPNADIIMGSNQ